MRTYTQLTSEQRYQIYALVKMKHSQTEIAQILKVNKATVSRELRRNKGERGYRPKQAHEKALVRRSKVRPRIEKGVWKIVDEKLCEDWSPEQVSGWFKKQGGQGIITRIFTDLF